jgi:hypothetical protein
MENIHLGMEMNRLPKQKIISIFNETGPLKFKFSPQF